MSAPRFEVGQHVWIRSVNRGQNGEGVVTKVGRSLVHVQGPWGSPTPYRMDTGVANDQFGHKHILTDDEMAEVDRRAAVDERWKAHGLRFEYGHGHQTPVDVMEAIADLLDGAA